MKTKTYSWAILMIAVILSVIIMPAAFADGKAVYEGQCAKCHGPDGKGQTKMGQKLGVKDYSTAKAWNEVKPGADVKAVKSGLKDGDKTLMKAFDLSDGDTKAVTEYMRSLAKK